jgi:hypothetical protein
LPAEATFGNKFKTLIPASSSLPAETTATISSAANRWVCKISMAISKDLGAWMGGTYFKSGANLLRASGVPTYYIRQNGFVNGDFINAYAIGG